MLDIKRNRLIRLPAVFNSLPQLRKKCQIDGRQSHGPGPFQDRLTPLFRAGGSGKIGGVNMNSVPDGDMGMDGGDDLGDVADVR